MMAITETSKGAPSPGTRATVRKRDTLAARENRAGLTFLAPTLVVVLVVVVLPILWTFLLAFQRIKLLNVREAGILGDYTFRNFALVLGSPGFWSSVLTTLIYTVGATVLSIGLGLVAALALRKPFRGRGLLRASMLLPYVAPVVAATFVWQIMLNPQFGIVNEWGTSLFGWDRPLDFLNQRETSVSLLGLEIPIPIALLTVIAFEGWRYFPFAFLFILARLQAVPHELEEAALVDGAAPTQKFWHVLMPQLASVIALLAVLRFIFTFNKFDDVYLLTGGAAGTEVVAVRVYDFLTSRFDIGAASAQALVLSVLLVGLLVLYLRFLGRRVEGD